MSGPTPRQESLHRLCNYFAGVKPTSGTTNSAAWLRILLGRAPGQRHVTTLLLSLAATLHGPVTALARRTATPLGTELACRTTHFCPDGHERLPDLVPAQSSGAGHLRRPRCSRPIDQRTEPTSNLGQFRSLIRWTESAEPAALRGWDFLQRGASYSSRPRYCSAHRSVERHRTNSLARRRWINSPWATGPRGESALVGSRRRHCRAGRLTRR
jgi:hypothetical protein